MLETFLLTGHSVPLVGNVFAEGHSVTSRPKAGLGLVLISKCSEKDALLRISQQIRVGGQREFGNWLQFPTLQLRMQFLLILKSRKEEIVKDFSSSIFVICC